MKPTTTRDQPRPKKQEAKTRSKPTKNEAKTESQEKQEEGPKKAGKEELKQQQPNRRHTTNPSDSCLGRSLVIPNIRKALT
jgi:hypothetical protein